MAQKIVLRAQSKRPDPDRSHYVLYMALIFPLALLTVFMKRLFRLGDASTCSNSISAPFFGEVMEYCRSVVPWVFMGR